MSARDSGDAVGAGESARPRRRFQDSASTDSAACAFRRTNVSAQTTVQQTFNGCYGSDHPGDTDRSDPRFRQKRSTHPAYQRTQNPVAHANTVKYQSTRACSRNRGKASITLRRLGQLLDLGFLRCPADSSRVTGISWYQIHRREAKFKDGFGTQCGHQRSSPNSSQRFEVLPRRHAS